jgi:hypothetical protein
VAAAEFVGEETVESVSLHLSAVDGSPVESCHAGSLLHLDTFLMKLQDFGYEASDGSVHLLENVVITVVAPAGGTILGKYRSRVRLIGWAAGILDFELLLPDGRRLRASRNGD